MAFRQDASAWLDGLDAVWARRLTLFSAPVRARIRRLADDRGGLDGRRMAFFNGAVEQRCVDGGRWD